ncbi:hypothetical protein V6R21_22495 [Limibacter armeniacum]|uniref:hypothetical protein n=1 Tax=Limibacter armeniacum TaxID=466084 RepID=UPI002FE6B0D9
MRLTLGLPLLIFLILFIYQYYRQRFVMAFVLVPFIAFSMYMLAAPYTCSQINERQYGYMADIEVGKPLGLLEKWNIYGLNISMGLIAPMVGYPEAGLHTLAMMIPNDGGKKVFTGDFFLRKSAMVREAFMKGEKQVRWYQRHYNITNEEARVALALNVAHIRVEDGYYKIKAQVSYPKKCRSHMINLSWLKLDMEEGLIRYLEEEGWLFPYWVEWQYPVSDFVLN